MNQEVVKENPKEPVYVMENSNVFPSVGVRHQENRGLNKNESFERFLKEMEMN